MNDNAKTLDDLNLDLSRLYDGLNKGTVDLKTAQELANIGGKLFKIQALKWAKEVFAADPRTAPRLLGDDFAREEKDVTAITHN